MIGDDIASDESKLEVLHEHYVDTFEQIKDALNERDRLFAYILITIFVMLLQVVAPKDTDAALGKLVEDKLGLSGELSVSVLMTVLQFALLGFVVRYSRSVIHVEGQYTYLRSLEQLLSAQFGGSAFTREGKSYMIRSLLFSKWTWFIYTIAFPLLLVVVLAVNLVAELSRAAALSRPLLVFDALVFLAIITSVALYLAAVHLKR